MTRTSSAKPMLKDLIPVLRTVAPVTTLITGAAFVVGLAAKFGGYSYLNVGIGAMVVAMGGLVLLYRKRKKIDEVLVEKVRRRAGVKAP